MATSEQRQRIELLKLAQAAKRARAGIPGTVCVVQRYAGETSEDCIEAAVSDGADISGLLIVLGSRLTREAFEERRRAGRIAAWSTGFNGRFIEHPMFGKSADATT